MVPGHRLPADEMFRGVGAPAVKFAALLSVSLQPAPALLSAFMLLGAGAAPAPSKQLAVGP